MNLQRLWNSVIQVWRVNLSTKLTQVVSQASKGKPVSTPLVAAAAAEVTFNAPDWRVSPRAAAKVKKLAAMPDSTFVDKKQPSYVRTLRDEVREYAEVMKALQKVRLDVQSKVPGLSVELKDDLAVVYLDERGYEHERILEVKMSTPKAEADGTLAFQYGDFHVSVDVKKGQTRESILDRLQARIEKQQGKLPEGGACTETSRELLLHRFRPMTEDEQKRRDHALR
jgi:hypothetical protein